MIKKFDEFIKEGFLSKTLGRSKSGEIRKEDGRRVKTSLGDVVLKNPNCDYEGFIVETCDGEHYNDFRIDWVDMRNFSSDELKTINNDTAIYTFKINNQVAIQFATYEEMVDGEVFDEEDYCEDDYISLCRLIAETVRKGDVDYVDVDGEGNDIYGFLLVDDYVIQDMMNVDYDEVDERDYWDENPVFERFKKDFKENFDGHHCLIFDNGKIYSKIYYYTISHIEEIMSFTKKYFGI